MSFFVNDGLIGCKDKNLTLYFTGSDTEKVFLDQIKSKPTDWYYKDTEITYTYNNYGHRCSNITDINLDNYILFLGCSHTFGIGNKLEDSYPYVLSKKLGMDYYNLALGATGTDSNRHNLSVWLEKFSKPKYIIWQWPRSPRFLYASDINKHPIALKGAIPQEPREDVSRSLFHLDRLNYFFIIDYLAYMHLRSIDVPVLQIQIDGAGQFDQFTHTKQQTDSYITSFPIMDAARDNQHYGLKTNSNIANVLYNKITNSDY